MSFLGVGNAMQPVEPNPQNKARKDPSEVTVEPQASVRRPVVGSRLGLAAPRPVPGWPHCGGHSSCHGRGLNRANRRDSKAQPGERDPTECCAYGLCDIIPFLAYGD